MTVALSRALESVQLQKRVMNIIFPDKDYKLSLIIALIDTLEERREVRDRAIFQNSRHAGVLVSLFR